MWRSGLPRTANKSEQVLLNPGDLTGRCRNASKGPNTPRLWGSCERKIEHEGRTRLKKQGTNPVVGLGDKVGAWF